MQNNDSKPKEKYLFGGKGLKIFVGAFLILIALFPFWGYFYYKGALIKKNYPEQKISKGEDTTTLADIIINPGTTTEEIVDQLYKADLINSKILLKTHLFLNKEVLQAGHYKIPYNLNVLELALYMQKGTFDERITFLEGWRREEYANAISKTFGLKIAEDFLYLTENLEGYLFPDTYFLPKESNAKLIVEELSNTFDTKILKTLIGQNQHRNLSVKDIIILASLVEREVSENQDRSIVAGILIKRLENDWPLDVDATIQYALTQEKINEGKTIEEYWPKTITQKNLTIESSYNTRLNKGLPPAPICNPGESSIQGVLNPVNTEYWFYLTGLDGKMYYAKTLEEHETNILNYL